MEEITTRFEIVRLAVKMADHETVAVQVKKLRDISLDEDLNEIISLLETKNYRQALFLMKGYVNSLDDSFFNAPPAAPVPKKRKAPEPPQEAQSLFDMMQPQVSQTINLDDMLRMTEESAGETVAHHEPERTTETYVTQAKEEVQKNEPYLDIYKNRAENKRVKPQEETVEEVLVDMQGETVTVEVPPEPVISSTEAYTPDPEPETEDIVPVFEAPKRELETKEEIREIVEVVQEISDTNTIEAEIEAEAVSTDIESVETEMSAEVSVGKNIEPETQEQEIEATLDKEALIDMDEKRDLVEEIEEDLEADPEDNLEADLEGSSERLSIEVVEKVVEAGGISLSSVKPVAKEIDISQEHNTEKEEDVLKIKRKEDYNKENRRYPPISYIDQKFRNMRHQFPQTEESEHGIVDEVKVLLKQVATLGYTENDIHDAIVFFQEKKSEGEMAEAAQMLLLAAASESKYAQLLLARELFKGEVLKVDYPESFTQINRLAEHDYPEAICDLAQLYEYGYGIKKDKKTAQLLYEEAAEMGVERAQKHVERLSGKRGILSAFFK